MLGWLRDSGATHVHAHFGTNPAEVAMLVHTLGGSALQLHRARARGVRPPAVLRLGEKLRRAAFAVAVSSYGRSQLYRWVEAAHWPRIHVVHCGLERAFHAVASTPLPARPRPRLRRAAVRAEGTALLLQAAQRLRQRGVDFELVLAGDGDMRAEVDAAVAALGLAAQLCASPAGSAASRCATRSSPPRAGARELRRRPAGGRDGGDGAAPASDHHARRRHPRARAAARQRLAGSGRRRRALADAMAACLATTPRCSRAWATPRGAAVLERHDIDTEAAKLAALFGKPAARSALAA
jgi:glycosyltransferase involved in cell wall biosynthesis